LAAKSIRYGQRRRLAPNKAVIAEIVSPWKTMHDENWIDRGMFTPVQDAV
jgi:hypothetical protein